MSNSAFTPSTTTVTNNVPVNVPVVTAWEAYTPDIFEGSNLKNSDFSSRNGRHRRVGDSVQIEMVLLGNSNARSGTGQFCVSIPSGLTIDTTKLSDSSRSLTGNISIGTGSPLDGVVSISRTSNLIGAIDKVVGTIAYNNTTLNPANAEMSIYATVPIAEWAGSGTTTLATRAVEEYAWNSNTADGNDTTSFAYGPSGVVFGSYTSNRQKTVRFQSAILPTDSLAIEILIPGSTAWQPIQTVNNYASIFVEAGATNYGMRFEPLNSTDVIIIFGAWRKPSSGTYAAAGAPWSDITTTRWRLRKVSGGAAVGFPVSARNIVGDTSGSVVPTGMLGERIFSQASGISVAASNTIRGLGTLSFQAGTWMIFCSSSLTWSGDPNGSSLILSTTSATSNVFTQLGMTAANVNDVSMSTSSNPANTRFGSINGIVATFTSQTTVFVNIYSFNSVSSSNASYSIWAVRIA